MIEINIAIGRTLSLLGLMYLQTQYCLVLT